MSDLEHRNTLKLLKPYSDPCNRKAVLQLINTVIPYVTLTVFNFWLYGKNPWLSLVMTIPIALFGIRMFIIQHDCGHHSFFKNQTANRWLGRIIGFFTLTPYEFWKHQHAVHHATTGNLSKRGSGDVLTCTVNEYLKMTLFQKLYYRANRNPFILFPFGGPLLFFFIHRFPTYVDIKNRRSWKSVMIYNLFYLVLTIVISMTLGAKALLIAYAPAIIMLSIAGAWAFYVQHQYRNAYWKWDTDWNFYKAAIEGSSHYQLPPILDWITGYIGYHHIHHLSSRIPNYHLKRCFNENPVLKAKNTLNLRTALKCAWLALWDESQQKMISFKELKAHTARSES